MEEEALVRQFQKLSWETTADSILLSPWGSSNSGVLSNPGEWSLLCEGRALIPHYVRVRAAQNIPSQAYLGDMGGRRCYAWEETPSTNLFWVDDDLVLDCSKSPRCVLSLLREGFYEGIPCNCELAIFPDVKDPSYLHVGMKTIRPISAGDELIFQRPCPPYY